MKATKDRSKTSSIERKACNNSALQLEKFHMLRKFVKGELVSLEESEGCAAENWRIGNPKHG